VRVIDANVLLNAVNSSADHYQVAHDWLEGALNGDEVVGIPWLVIIAFIRISTLPHGFPKPFDVSAALHFVRDWLSVSNVVVLNVPSTDDHLDIVEALLNKAGRAGNLVNDAHIAAIAQVLDAEVVTFDSDFGKFPGIRWITPGQV